jgi:hypothetical protein
MARGDAKKAADDWLKKQGIIEDVTDEDYELVKKLIGNPSFGIFWAMLRWRRERSAILLSNASLGSPERDSSASVLQGHIRAIDEVRQMILEIAEPNADAAGTSEEQTNGQS